MHNYIEIAMGRRAPVRVPIEALRETVEKREGAAFLSGLVMGAASGEKQSACFSEAQHKNPQAVISKKDTLEEVDQVPAKARRSPILRRAKHTIILLAIMAATGGVSLAAGWHTADAEWQNRSIETIETLKKRGWAPVPQAERTGPTDEIYNRIKGVAK